MTNVVVTKPRRVVVVTSKGGKQGPPGSGTQSFRFTQAAPSNNWVIAHNLNRNPQCDVFSVGGKQMLGEVLHLSLNTLSIFFDEPLAGFAILT